MEGGGREAEKRKRRQAQDKLYRGIRMRKWGKWVAEIREPNKRSRIWLGSYSSPIAAARAYDTAVFHLRGPSAKLNFPELLANEEWVPDLSAVDIRRRAAEVGTRVDALQMAGPDQPNPEQNPIQPRAVAVKPDLNEYPTPESSGEDNSGYGGDQ
ncbi:unnamed protein product [Cuscuta epithymum]|uniref:AP2/ERF domain-containing protein n=1 Tax=Cuscuta epithymum TaxID=186058 RepID=A0AAV0GAA1_9ASTE|nr:unnamed protein product [Cuscuta epithymum]CAH9144869.1 unnamed protein product [Cuscuta epithymum]